jgi:carbamoyltransferase
VALTNRLLSDESQQMHSPLFEVALPASNTGRFEHPKSYIDFLKSIPCETIDICHHLAHSASAFWASGFDSATCLTYDGGVYSNPWFGGLYSGDRDAGITHLDMFNRLCHPNVADLYSFVTALLGFTPNRHEGKVTGLAALGVPSDACRELISRWYRDNVAITGRATNWVFSNDTQRSPIGVADDATMAPFRDDAIRFSREEIAATLQEFCENHIATLIAKAAQNGWTGSKICLAGGLFANVKINQRIAAMGFEEIFVAPPMTDDGTALGAAWQVLAEHNGVKPPPLRDVYLGSAYDSSVIRQQLDTQGINYTLMRSPASEVADILARGAIVAVFQGAMEFGPRALGNRSILAQAINPDINNSLNKRLSRTEFMPFAPVSRIEDAETCYLGASRIRNTARFMTVTSDCTDMMKKLCPAVVHVDGTARPQLVDSKDNPFIHEVLTLYQRSTGRPALVNTSFNIHEEPIVCTPSDAIKGFFESGLDYLFFGDNILVSFEANRNVALHHLQTRLRQPSQKQETLQAILKIKSEEIQSYRREIEKIKSDISTFSSENSALKYRLEMLEESRLIRIQRRLTYLASRLSRFFGSMR